ncbi:MAG: phosphoserine phosphatase SerB [Rhizobiaceae bacterium]
MSLVATLVCAPQSQVITSEVAHRAAAAAGASAIDVLADGVAVDLRFDDSQNRDELAPRLRAPLAGLPVDVVIQSARTRRKKILIADMDSTMIDQECIDELADEIGIRDQVAEITARSMNGEIAFEPALRERVALLAGLRESVVDRIVRDRIKLAAGARELVATMNAAGAHTALVSGGFDVFTARIASMLGFNEHRANHLLAANGRFTGKVAEPILGRAAKAQALLEIARRAGVTPEDALAVGDGANDLDMIRLAGAGVALHAKPVVAEQAEFRIDHGDLTALLYIQGYRRDEFAT